MPQMPSHRRWSSTRSNLQVWNSLLLLLLLALSQRLKIVLSVQQNQGRIDGQRRGQGDLHWKPPQRKDWLILFATTGADSETGKYWYYLYFSTDQSPSKSHLFAAGVGAQWITFYRALHTVSHLHPQTAIINLIMFSKWAKRFKIITTASFRFFLKSRKKVRRLHWEQQNSFDRRECGHGIEQLDCRGVMPTYCRGQCATSKYV